MYYLGQDVCRGHPFYAGIPEHDTVYSVENFNKALNVSCQIIPSLISKLSWYFFTSSLTLYNYHDH